MVMQHFDAIVPEKSPIRSLPASLEPRMRMRIDALIYSADAISYNWHQLKTVAEFVQHEVSRLDHRSRAAMLSAAWSIVDELDAVRQLVWTMVDADTQPGPFTQRLLDACRPVQQLRNKMRHLAGNLRTIAASKKRSALLGALSWFWCPEYRLGQGWILVVQSGMLHGGERISAVNPDGRNVTPPVDLFQLEAFGLKLDLTKPIMAFAEWIEESASDWLRQLDGQISAYVLATGTDEAALRGHIGGGFARARAINFEPPTLPLQSENSSVPDGQARRKTTERPKVGR